MMCILMPKSRDEADALLRGIYGAEKWEAHLAQKARLRDRLKALRSGEADKANDNEKDANQ